MASLNVSCRSALGIAVALAAFATQPGSASARSAQGADANTLTVTIADADGLVESPPWGRVTSSPPGIDCPEDCSEPFQPGAHVELTATATAGYALGSWLAFPDDPGCQQPPTCKVTIGEALGANVTASFHPAAQLHAVPRGAGTIELSPAQEGRSSLCDVDFQQEAPGSSCTQRYVTGTQVTLTAHPAAAGKFIGWSDFACSNSSRSCTLRMSGERFIAARFSPVQLSVNPGAFGAVEVDPAPNDGFCALLPESPPCTFTYPAGTLVSVRRDHAAAGQSWVGACLRNIRGLLDADVCRLRLLGDELVAAGADNVTFIPPPLGSGIQVKLGGNKRGRVTGTVINGGETLDCGTRCTISGLTSYERVYLTARSFRGSRFVGWSDGNRLGRRTVSVANVNRIKANFKSRRR